MIKLFFIILLSSSVFAEDAAYRELISSGFMVNTPLATIETNNFNFENSFSYHPGANRTRKHDLNVKMVNRVPAQHQDRAELVIPSALVVADHFRLDPYYLVSVIWVESDFQSNAKSKKGAHGFMQLMPKTKLYLKNKIGREDYRALNHKIKRMELNELQRENLILGAFYLKELKARYKDPKLAAIAYNMGPSWLDDQRKNLIPVGTKNRYLNKLKDRYWKLSGINY